MATLGYCRHMGTPCPIDGCEAEPSSINNHVHASSGDGHGPQYEYPEGWDKETAGFSDGSQTADDGGGGNVADTSEVAKKDRATTEATDTGGPQAEAISLDDDPMNAREYRCGECGNQVGYLSDTCRHCDSGLVWGGVDRDSDELDNSDDDGETAEVDN